MNNQLSKLNVLRSLIAEKFPQQPSKPISWLHTNYEAIDQINGGLPKGAITEVYGPSAAGQLLLATLLKTIVQDGCYIGLIDGADSFDPAEWPEEQLHRILWVKCNTADTALNATDLLLRDGNLPVLVLDLQLVPLTQLQRIPTSIWHRFKRLIENTPLVLIVLTPQPLVQSISTRIAIKTAWTLEAIDLDRSRLLKQMKNNEHWIHNKTPSRYVA